MLDILLCVSTGIILFAYFLYFVLIFIYNKKISNSNVLDILTDVLSEYNGINIILSKGIFSYYNIQRKIIKLTDKCYYGDTISYLSIALIEAGYFVSDRIGNKYIDLFRKIIPTLKIFYLLPIISVVIGNSIYNSSDSIFGIISLGLFIYIAYLLMNIKKQMCLEIIEKDKMKVLNNCVARFIKYTIVLELMIIFGEFIMLSRFLMLMIL